MLFGSKKVIGLDIGLTSVKVAEMTISRNSAVLQRFAILDVPPAAVAAGDIEDPYMYGDLVKSLISNASIKQKNVCTGMWGPSVVVKKIAIPKMEKKFVPEQIRWEAEQYIPFDIGDVSLDYTFLGKTGDYDTMDVLLVAARKEQIVKYAEVVESAGLKLSVLDLNGFALANSFLFNYGPSKTPIGLLNIGSQYTNFVVIDGKDVLFCRDVPVGGQIYSVDIQKAMGVSLVEAESLKLSATHGQAPEEIASVIESTHEIYCDEILGSLDFFENTTPGVAVQKFYVTGGGVRTPGLTQALASTLQRDIEHFNPFLKVNRGRSLDQKFMDQVSDMASVASGLALRKIGDA